MRALAAPIAVLALAAFAAPAHAQAGTTVSYEYTTCASVGEASIVQVVGAPCSDAEAVAAQVVAVPAASEKAVLLAAGWKATRAESTDDGTQHDVVAVRDAGGALRIRRPGPAPDLDGWEAGRELLLAGKPLVGGKPVPKGAVLCTSSWLVQVTSGSLGGLTAGHCGGLSKKGKVRRRNVALRRPPQPGIVLGPVQRILTRTVPFDALLAPVPSGPTRTHVPVIDRGVSRPPWLVTGVAQPTPGRRICFTGRTSGVDQCGAIRGNQVRGAEALLSAFAGVVVRCTSIRAREGDSGGPVYTAPRADGTVRAVGLTTLIVGDTAQMCFTPLIPVLNSLHAKLVVAG